MNECQTNQWVISEELRKFLNKEINFKLEITVRWLQNTNPFYIQAIALLNSQLYLLSFLNYTARVVDCNGWRILVLNLVYTMIDGQNIGLYKLYRFTSVVEFLLKGKAWETRLFVPVGSCSHSYELFTYNWSHSD